MTISLVLVVVVVVPMYFYAKNSVNCQETASTSRVSAIIIIIIIICSLLRVFHTSISRWFLPGVWLTTNPLKSPGLFSLLLLLLLLLLLFVSVYLMCLRVRDATLLFVTKESVFSNSQSPFSPVLPIILMIRPGYSWPLHRTEITDLLDSSTVLVFYVAL